MTTEISVLININLALPEAYCYDGITVFPTYHAYRIFPSAQHNVPLYFNSSKALRACQFCEPSGYSNSFFTCTIFFTGFYLVPR